ncbi:hypothetical protein VCHA50P415_20088 [Vibrio chagasii]|nr:hypothetical protein VCHA27O13_130088 [Vibrio chagasii]CAH6799258.1 hypothetical protein VCHA36P164_100119 [Vibrio chagasii]CAH6847779.1 hypothetical protein VCHA35O143_10367 [Vibrio chagasii]CAH6849536.1 hypothetical protein VCHA31O73_10574 [Vibrio chagasii]CAH6876560.1 hypothetical protein VCHA34P115_20073 [Vibrio chagasii]
MFFSLLFVLCDWRQENNSETQYATQYISIFVILVEAMIGFVNISICGFYMEEQESHKLAILI